MAKNPIVTTCERVKIKKKHIIWRICGKLPPSATHPSMTFMHLLSNDRRIGVSSHERKIMIDLLCLHPMKLRAHSIERMRNHPCFAFAKSRYSVRLPSGESCIQPISEEELTVLAHLNDLATVHYHYPIRSLYCGKPMGND